MCVCVCVCRGVMSRIRILRTQKIKVPYVEIPELLKVPSFRQAKVLIIIIIILTWLGAGFTGVVPTGSVPAIDLTYIHRSSGILRPTGQPGTALHLK